MSISGIGDFFSSFKSIVYDEFDHINYTCNRDVKIVSQQLINHFSPLTWSVFQPDRALASIEENRISRIAEESLRDLIARIKRVLNVFSDHLACEPDSEQYFYNSVREAIFERANANLVLDDDGLNMLVSKSYNKSYDFKQPKASYLFDPFELDLNKECKFFVSNILKFVDCEFEKIIYLTRKDVKTVHDILISEFLNFSDYNESSSRIKAACLRNGISIETQKSLEEFLDNLLIIFIPSFSNLKLKILATQRVINLVDKFSLFNDKESDQLIHRSQDQLFHQKQFNGRSQTYKDELRGFNLKVEYLDMNKFRNFEISPSEDTALLKKLISKDINLIQNFPNLLMDSKAAIIITLAHLQSSVKFAINSPNIDLSKLSSTLKEDKDIFKKAGSHPQTFKYLNCAGESVKSDLELFQVIAKRIPEALSFASASVKNNPELAVRAVQKDPGAFAGIGDQMQNDSNLMFSLVKAHFAKSDRISDAIPVDQSTTIQPMDQPTATSSETKHLIKKKRWVLSYFKMGKFLMAHFIRPIQLAINYVKDLKSRFFSEKDAAY